MVQLLRTMMIAFAMTCMSFAATAQELKPVEVVGCDGELTEVLAQDFNSLSPETQALFYQKPDRVALPGEFIGFGCDCADEDLINIQDQNQTPWSTQETAPVETVAQDPTPPVAVVQTVPTPTPAITNVIPAIGVGVALASLGVTTDPAVDRASIFAGLLEDGRQNVTTYPAPNPLALGHQVQSTDNFLFGASYERGMTMRGVPIAVNIEAAYVAGDYRLESTGLQRNGTIVSLERDEATSGFEVGISAQADVFANETFTGTILGSLSADNVRGYGDNVDFTAELAARVAAPVSENLAVYSQLGVHHTDVFGRATDAKALVGAVASAKINDNFRLDANVYGGQYLIDANELYGTEINLVNPTEGWQLGIVYEEMPRGLIGKTTSSTGVHQVADARERRALIKVSKPF